MSKSDHGDDDAGQRRTLKLRGDVSLERVKAILAAAGEGGYELSVGMRGPDGSVVSLSGVQADEQAGVEANHRPEVQKSDDDAE